MASNRRRLDRRHGAGDAPRRRVGAGAVRPGALTCAQLCAGQSGQGLAGLAIGAVAVSVGRDAARTAPTALSAGGTVDSLLGCAAGFVAAGCAGWLALVLIVASARVLPSGLGRVAALVGDAVTPPLLRQALVVALGTGLALGAAPASAGAATRPTPSPTSTAVPMVVLDRPAAPPTAGAQASAAPPTAGAQASAAPPTARAAASDATVTVRHGDSLWSIAARSLGPAASDHDVAKAWPAWWAANRTVVGADPDLILPGQRLRPPPGPSAHLETR